MNLYEYLNVRLVFIGRDLLNNFVVNIFVLTTFYKLQCNIFKSMLLETICIKDMMKNS
jgi:hypothetical protein